MGILELDLVTNESLFFESEHSSCLLVLMAGYI